MNHISIDKLYNPQYDLLSVSDKKALLNTLAAIYNLELICFKEFKAFEKSTYTAVYRSNDGIDFVFVPGDTVTLGLNFKNKPLQDIFNDENLAKLVYPFVEGYEEEILSEEDVQRKISETLEDEEVLSNIETYFTHNFTQEGEFVIPPLLVQKEYSETCWIPISDEELIQNKEWQNMIKKESDFITNFIRTIGADKVFKSLDLDILYFGANASEWLAMSEKVIALLLPNTQVNSRVLTPLSYPNMIYRDHVGHIFVKYEWLDDLLERSKEAQDLNMVHDNNENIPRLRNYEKMQIIENNMKEVK